MIRTNSNNIVLTMFISTLFLVFTLGSCNLDPKLEIEGIEAEDNGGGSQNEYSFPIYELEDLQVSEVRNKIAAVLARELLIVIDPIMRSYKVYNLGTFKAEFVRVGPGANKIAIVTELSGATGNIQYGVKVWNIVTQSEEFNEIFYGDVRDVEWDVLGDDVLIVGEENNNDTYLLYKTDVDRFRDVTSTYIEPPFGYELDGYGIIEIATSYGYYGSLYATVVTRREGGSSSSRRYIINRYDRSSGFVTDIKSSNQTYTALTVSRNDEYLLYRYNSSLYIMDPSSSGSSQLPTSAVEYDSSTTRYCVDNDEENIYSVDKASLNILRYNISSGSIITLPLIMDEVFTLNCFHYVK